MPTPEPAAKFRVESSSSGHRNAWKKPTGLRNTSWKPSQRAGWLAGAALEMAFARRRPAPGLVHHSDQGVQCQPRLCRCARGAPSPNQEPESPPRHDGVSYFHVYEFDLQRSSEHALLALYMSLKIAMRDSWKSLPIAARMHWARLFSTKAAVFQRAACTS